MGHRDNDQRTGSEARERRIIAVIIALEPGEVSTYGDIAADAGYPRRARLVGRVLNTTEIEVPWWRVVNARGRLVPGNEREHAAILRSEGVTVRNGFVIDAPIGRFRRVGFDPHRNTG